MNLLFPCDRVAVSIQKRPHQNDIADGFDSQEGCKSTYLRTESGIESPTAKFRHVKAFRKLRLLLSKKNSLSTSYARIFFWAAAIWLLYGGTESKFWFSCKGTRNYSRRTFPKAIAIAWTRSSIAKFRNQTWMVGITFLLCATKLIIFIWRGSALTLNDFLQILQMSPEFPAANLQNEVFQTFP